MAKLESDNQRRLGSAISLPFFVIIGILGFGSPVFFSAISETSLEDVGDGTKTLDEEMVRQLRQNNLGPAEMLLPLTSVDRREEYANTIRDKMTPKLEISGGGSIFDLFWGCILAAFCAFWEACVLRTLRSVATKPLGRLPESAQIIKKILREIQP